MQGNRLTESNKYAPINITRVVNNLSTRAIVDVVGRPIVGLQKQTRAATQCGPPNQPGSIKVSISQAEVQQFNSLFFSFPTTLDNFKTILCILLLEKKGINLLKKHGTIIRNKNAGNF